MSRREQGVTYREDENSVLLKTRQRCTECGNKFFEAPDWNEDVVWCADCGREYTE